MGYRHRRTRQESGDLDKFPRSAKAFKKQSLSSKARTRKEQRANEREDARLKARQARAASAETERARRPSRTQASAPKAEDEGKQG